MRIDEILVTDHVVVPLRAPTREVAIGLLVSHLAYAGLVEDPIATTLALIDRERLFPFDILPGAAVPHLHTESVTEPLLAVGLLDEPIPWSNRNQDGVKLIFLLLQPPTDLPDLRLLASLVAYLNHAATLQELSCCHDREEFYTAILRIGIDLDAPDGLMPIGTIQAHSRPTVGLAISSDDNLVASSSIAEAGTICISSVHGSGGGSCVLGTLRGHERYVTGLAWHPREPWLASGSFDETIRLWDLTDRANLSQVEPTTYQLGAPVHGVSWSHEGTMVAVAAHEMGARIYRHPGSEQLSAIDFDNVLSVVWSPSSDRLALSHGRLTTAVSIWDASERTVAHTYDLSAGAISCMAWQPSEANLLAAASIDGSVYILDLRDGVWQQIQASDQELVLGMAFSQNGKYLVCKGRDRTVRVRSTATWQVAAQFREPAPDQELVAQIAYSRKSARFLTDGGHGGLIRVWSVDEPKLDRLSRIAAMQPKNRGAIPQGLIESLRQREAVLFAGAGMSISALGITTDALVGDICQQIMNDLPNYDRTHRQPQDIFDEFAALVDLNTLQRTLEILIPTGKPTRAHEAAVRIFPTIITTNWDDLFERAFDAADIRFRVVVENKDTAVPSTEMSQLIKMHGTVRQPMTLIATTTQFAAYHLTHTAVLDRVVSLLHQKRPIFVGYGLRDEHIRRILAQAENQHTLKGYAVGFYDEARTRLLASLGIQTIPIGANEFFDTVANLLDGHEGAPTNRT